MKSTASIAKISAFMAAIITAALWYWLKDSPLEGETIYWVCVAAFLVSFAGLYQAGIDQAAKEKIIDSKRG